ncbi:MAG: molybdopterin molybdotransferase MoeA, partial [Candidatus Cloacimonadota bacterium]|nr:molybdopterin molybdotransferase MoeA [Candidatus Cloacimonadota bacterium]
TEKVSIYDSVGRVLAKDIVSDIEMPRFNRAAMDGYAARFKDFQNVPVDLKVAGIIEAGQIFDKPIKSGECVKIMTGAATPKALNSLVKIEDTKQVGDIVTINQAGKLMGNIAEQGEDISIGEVVIKKGIKISASHISTIATIGKSELEVFKKPSVSIVNTGGEIVEIGQSLKKNQIYNSSGPTLQVLLKKDNLKLDYVLHAKDNEHELKTAFSKGMNSDILIITGGVSMGEYDLVPKMLSEMGIKKIFHKVKVKPGKPTFFGKMNKTLVFGMPGNPVSTFLAYHLYIQTVAKKMMGYNNFLPNFKEGFIAIDYQKKNSYRKNFTISTIEIVDGKTYLTPITYHGSGDMHSLSNGDGFIIMNSDKINFTRNEKVRFFSWKNL